jgi:hypothetical protein
MILYTYIYYIYAHINVYINTYEYIHMYLYLYFIYIPLCIYRMIAGANNMMMMAPTEPRQTTSNIGFLKKPTIQARIHGLDRHYYSLGLYINICMYVYIYTYIYVHIYIYVYGGKDVFYQNLQ